MKILITGGGGLIGQAIAKEHLAAGHEVFIYDNRSNPYNDYSNLVGEDVSKLALETILSMHDFDVISHQAAFVGVGESQYNIEKYVDNNVTFTAHLLNLISNLNKFPKVFMLAGSMGPYGEGPYVCKYDAVVYPKRASFGDPVCPLCGGSIIPIDITEQTPRNPKSIYGFTKMAQEDLVRVFSETYKMNTVSMRYFSVYGNECNPNNPYTGVLSVIANKIINSGAVSLYEDGEQTRDLISALDVASAHRLLVEKGLEGFHVFNVGTGKATPMRYIAERMIQRLSPEKVLVFLNNYRSGDIRNSLAQIKKIQSTIPWSPQITIDQAIEDYCDFIEINWDSFQTIGDTTQIETEKLKTKGLL